jgi:hypothetical protein
MAKIDKKYRQLKENEKIDIRVILTYHLESVKRINEDINTLKDKDEIALI